MTSQTPSDDHSNMGRQTLSDGYPHMANHVSSSDGQSNTASHIPLTAESNMANQIPSDAHSEMASQVPADAHSTTASHMPLTADSNEAGQRPPTSDSNMADQMPLDGHPNVAGQIPLTAGTEAPRGRIFKQDTDNESLIARSMFNGQSSLKTNRYGNGFAKQRGMKYPVPQASSMYSPSEHSFDMLSTISMVGSFVDYPTENERTYASLDPDSYYMPNDEIEQDRLNLMHQLHYSILDSRLTLAPIQPDITHVLDIGTGTGEWAINMAETYPSAEVIGTDISAIQPTAVPSNVYFEIDDAELEWEYSHQFDLIHLRDLAGAFDDWPALYAQALKFLKPGGYIEIIDHDRPVVPGLRETKVLAPFIRAFEMSCAAAGRPHDTAHLQSSVLEAAGFTEITTHEARITLGGKTNSTSAGDLFKQRFGLVTLLETMESSVLRPLTRDGGWTSEEVKQTIEDCREEITALMTAPEGGYTPVHYVVARKPLD